MARWDEMVSSASALRHPARPSLARLRAITMAVPIIALAAALYLVAFASPEIVRTPIGYAIALGFVALAVVFFSHVVFRMVERLEQRVLRQNARLAAVASVATALSGPGDLATIVQGALDGSCPALDVDAAEVRWIDPRSGEQMSARYGPGLDGSMDLLVGDAGGPATGAVPGWDPLTPVVVVDDMAAEPGLRAMAARSGLRSLVGSPLVANGASEGTLFLGSRVPGYFTSEDQQVVQQIAHQIGVAAQRLDLLAEVVDRNEELALVNALSSELSGAREFDDVIDVVLSVLLRASGGRWAGFWHEERGRLVPLREVGSIAPRTTGALSVMHSTSSASGLVPAELLERVYRDGVASFVVDEGTELACLPLRSQGELYGVVTLDIDRPDPMTARRRRSLESIAEQSGPAVASARLRLRVREIAIIEERGRIAREMHDGLAQVLAYVNTKAAAARHSLEGGEIATAGSLLVDLEAAVQDASLDVREEMLALRSAEPGAGGLSGVVRGFVARYQRLSGIMVECQEIGDLAAAELPEMTELQVVRVIQEALANVRKHADVPRATVTLAVTGHLFVARVDDDGCGFDADAGRSPARPRFGLQTMRERAQSIGAELSVSSAPGHGTHVVISVPLRPSLAATA